MKAGSFFPNRPLPTFFAMAADDLPLHFDMEDLTEKQLADHYDQNRLLAMLQIALISISKPEDYLALFKAFTEEPWKGFLKQHHELATRIGFPVIPMDHLIYAPMETYYEDLVDKIPDVDLITFLMMSRSNQMIHKNQAAIDMMLKLNSKFHFAENAPAFGIPVPDTLVATQPLAGNKDAEAFFAKHDNKVILKMTGQPGARNVKAVGSIEEAEAFLTEYRNTDKVLMQERLALDNYVEWTADLLVTDKTVELDNVRRILVTDGLWIGNLMPAGNPMTDEQNATLLKLGAYARQFGFGTEVGDNLGIDYFIGPDGEILVTEINPRWTAGLFPSEALRRIDGRQSQAVAYFELIRLDQYESFLNFIGDNLAGQGGPFGIVHLGFSPYKMDAKGEDCVYCWLIVMGDFPAYREAAKALLGPGNLRNGNLVPL